MGSATRLVRIGVVLPFLLGDPLGVGKGLSTLACLPPPATSAKFALARLLARPDPVAANFMVDWFLVSVAESLARHLSAGWIALSRHGCTDVYIRHCEQQGWHNINSQDNLAISLCT